MGIYDWGQERGTYYIVMEHVSGRSMADVLRSTGPLQADRAAEIAAQAGMDYVEESAARYGIPVAQVYDAFMGPDGTDDPYLKGLLDDDQLHPNAAGAALMADLLDQFGY